MLAVRAKKENADRVLKRLLLLGAVDRGFRINKTNDCVDIPVLRQLGSEEIRRISLLGGKFHRYAGFVPRIRPRAPFAAIRATLEGVLDDGEMAMLPDKWEMLGDVLIIRLPRELLEFKTEVARAYAGVLGARTVLRDAGGISGVRREPVTEFLLGKNAGTVHVENGVRFSLDASRIMFASGNMGERKRMSRVSGPGETVVDMFAGIGYFSLPMAVYSKPLRIFSCEINPVAYRYLHRNVRLNKVGRIVRPLPGDCREVAPEGVADRVVMGHFDAHGFLGKAMRVLRPEGGVLHYHEACPIDRYERPVARVERAARAAGRPAGIIKFTVVKSYAPCISHVVADVKVGPARGKQ